MKNWTELHQVCAEHRPIVIAVFYSSDIIITPLCNVDDSHATRLENWGKISDFLTFQ